MSLRHQDNMYGLSSGFKEMRLAKQQGDKLFFHHTLLALCPAMALLTIRLKERMV